MILYFVAAARTLNDSIANSKTLSIPWENWPRRNFQKEKSRNIYILIENSNKLDNDNNSGEEKNMLPEMLQDCSHRRLETSMRYNFGLHTDNWQHHGLLQLEYPSKQSQPKLWLSLCTFSVACYLFVRYDLMNSSFIHPSIRPTPMQNCVGWLFVFFCGVDNQLVSFSMLQWWIKFHQAKWRCENLIEYHEKKRTRKMVEWTKASVAFEKKKCNFIWQMRVGASNKTAKMIFMFHISDQRHSNSFEAPNCVTASTSNDENLNEKKKLKTNKIHFTNKKRFEQLDSMKCLEAMKSK